MCETCPNNQFGSGKDKIKLKLPHEPTGDAHLALPLVWARQRIGEQLFERVAVETDRQRGAEQAPDGRAGAGVIHMAVGTAGYVGLSRVEDGSLVGRCELAPKERSVAVGPTGLVLILGAEGASARVQDVATGPSPTRGIAPRPPSRRPTCRHRMGTILAACA